MNRDPLYQKIVEALKRPLDGNAFQECAVAVIGKYHPNLAPLPGGDDAGMDGAFGTPEGPYPLICTVGTKVLENFRRNVSTYCSKRSGPPRVVVATSRFLSNRRKRNLDSAAKKLGITITNIFDGSYFAQELYRDSKWRMELLGIPGDSPALSLLPLTGRFVEPGVLVGRDDEMRWIEETAGDVLVVGQPGSGKTYLHQCLAARGKCLFIVDESQARLADAIRDQQPSVVVLDDAHINLPLVESIKRLRFALGATFAIHLNCWPRQEDKLQRILDIPEFNILRLQRLPKPRIVELIKQLGIHGPDWLLHLLLSTSDGKPGLAVALCEICKREDIKRVWNGDAVAQQLLGNPRIVRDERERCILAAFAIGGETGMSFS